MRWAVHGGVCRETSLPERVAALAEDLGLTMQVGTYDRAIALQAMQHDKKAGAGHVAVPVPRRAGEMTLVNVPVEELGGLLDAVSG